MSSYAILILPLPVMLVGIALHLIIYGDLRGRLSVRRANLLMLINQAAVPLIAAYTVRSVVGILLAIGLGWIIVSGAFFIVSPLKSDHIVDRARDLARYGVPRVPGDLLQLLLFALPGILTAHITDIGVAGIVERVTELGRCDGGDEGREDRVVRGGRGDRPLEKRRRDDICLACGIVMIVSVLWAASSVVTHAAIFWPESIAIIAFAVSWLTKGEIHKPAIRMMRTLRQRMRGAPAPVVLGVLLTTRLVIPSSAPVEQTEQGRRPPATLVASFDGLGVGLQGPHGRWEGRNPSDNSLAVGPDYVVQIVNTRIAIFRKNGAIVYGPVPTNSLFKGFGGACEAHNNGDAVVRYDQLANRWLIVMPVFTRSPERPDQPGMWQAQPQGGAYVSPPGVAGQPGPAAPLFVPPTVPPAPPEPPDTARRVRPPRPPEEKGPYSMCYAVSTSADPLGSYYRYEFLRPLFPDYPRPAVWPDGYYVPTSTGDEVIQKHACVADRRHMLLGEPATEQCVVIDGVNFLNNADLDGQGLPPEGAPNVILAAGGAQLHGDFDADGISAWQFSVNWTDPSQTRVSGLQKIAVAPYHYLCDGQLTTCVRQPGTDQHLDAQGDKIMARVVYRNIKGRESVVAVHSVATRAGGGGVRWYEFTVEKDRSLQLRQQGTYAPDSLYRWMASPAIDRDGNIGIGYSFGGSAHFAGQRFAARLAGDRLGMLTLHETVLAEGEAPQTNTMRWEDYTQTAIDPSDDCTIWYVGDYLKKGALTYSTRIGAFRLCE